MGIQSCPEKKELLTNMLPDKNKIINRNEPSCADQKAEIL